MNADGSNQTPIHETGAYSFPAWDPDGDHIAFNEGEELWRIDVGIVNGVPTGSNPYRLHAGPAYHAQWSPDGEWILFGPAGRGEPLQAIPAVGGTAETLYTPASNCAVYFPCWSPDGDRIAFFEYETGLGTALKILHLESGQVTTVLSHDPAANFRFLQWGRTDDVLVYDNGTTGDIYTLDLDTGETETVVEGNKKRAAQSPCWSPDDTKIVFSRSGIEVIELSTGDKEQLANSGRFPDWRK